MPRNEQALETPPEPVSVEVDGVVHAGTFRGGRGYVMLESVYGRATAPRGRFAPRQVAAILLRRLVAEADAARRAGPVTSEPAAPDADASPTPPIETLPGTPANVSHKSVARRGASLPAAAARLAATQYRQKDPKPSVRPAAAAAPRADA